MGSCLDCTQEEADHPFGSGNGGFSPGEHHSRDGLVLECALDEMQIVVGLEIQGPPRQVVRQPVEAAWLPIGFSGAVGPSDVITSN